MVCISDFLHHLTAVAIDISQISADASDVSINPWIVTATIREEAECVMTASYVNVVPLTEYLEVTTHVSDSPVFFTLPAKAGKMVGFSLTNDFPNSQFQLAFQVKKGGYPTIEDDFAVLPADNTEKTTLAEYFTLNEGPDTTVYFGLTPAKAGFVNFPISVMVSAFTTDVLEAQLGGNFNLTATIPANQSAVIKVNVPEDARILYMRLLATHPNAMALYNYEEVPTFAEKMSVDNYFEETTVTEEGMFIAVGFYPETTMIGDYYIRLFNFDEQTDLGFTVSFFLSGKC